MRAANSHEGLGHEIGPVHGAPAWPAGLPPLVESTLVKGGLVCETVAGRLADGRRVVVKRCPYDPAAEADGLQALATAGVPAPAVLGVAGGHQGGVLVMQRVDGPPDWPGLGRAVAHMHRQTGPAYGWHRDNYAGRFVQHNDWTADWPTFFAERRVRVHLGDPSVPADLARRLHAACDGPLPALLPKHPPASLTHGDLWGGNVVGGRWLVDPEVSYADRELDLAYMQSASGLPVEFFAAYFEQWPPEAGYEERREALRLHHLLLQVRHFGQRCVTGLAVVLDAYGW